MSLTGGGTLLLRLVRVHQPLPLPLRPTLELAHQLVEPVLDHNAAHAGCRQWACPAGQRRTEEDVEATEEDVRVSECVCLLLNVRR